MPLSNMKKLPRGVVTIRDCYTAGPTHSSPLPGEKQVNSLNKRRGHLSTTYRFIIYPASAKNSSIVVMFFAELVAKQWTQTIQNYYWKDWFRLDHLICNATLNTGRTREQRGAHNCIITHSCGKLQSITYVPISLSLFQRSSPAVKDSWPPYELH